MSTSRGDWGFCGDTRPFHRSVRKVAWETHFRGSTGGGRCWSPSTSESPDENPRGGDPVVRGSGGTEKDEYVENEYSIPIWRSPHSQAHDPGMGGGLSKKFSCDTYSGVNLQNGFEFSLLAPSHVARVVLFEHCVGTRV